MNVSELTSKISEYENGWLDDQETVELFQGLVDTGLAWTLQGHYGRTAALMLQRGIIHAPGSPLVPAAGGASCV